MLPKIVQRTCSSSTLPSYQTEVNTDNKARDNGLFVGQPCKPNGEGCLFETGPAGNDLLLRNSQRTFFLLLFSSSSSNQTKNNAENKALESRRARLTKCELTGEGCPPCLANGQGCAFADSAGINRRGIDFSLPPFQRTFSFFRSFSGHRTDQPHSFYRYWASKRPLSHMQSKWRGMH